jgi:hypothetical protein
MDMDARSMYGHLGESAERLKTIFRSFDTLLMLEFWCVPGLVLVSWVSVI